MFPIDRKPNSNRLRASVFPSLAPKRAKRQAQIPCFERACREGLSQKRSLGESEG